MNKLSTPVIRVVLILLITLPLDRQLHSADRSCPAPTHSTQTVMRDLTGDWTMRVLAAQITSSGRSRKVQPGRIPSASVLITENDDGLVMTPKMGSGTFS